MIHHIVLFKFESLPKNTLKEDFLKEAKEAFETLPDLIDCLVEMRSHININPNEEYDLMLQGVIATESDIEKYAQHPEHVKLVERYIKPYVAKRACVDVRV